MTTPAPAALMFSSDLFFGSKVTGTASALGLQVELTGNVQQGLAKLADGKFRCVILDLAMPGLAPAAVTAAIGHVAEDQRPRVVAFGSHVHTARLEEARQAGCDDVMPRSRFSAQLVPILQQACGGDEMENR